MPITLAFDVYGTLIDTQGVVSSLETMVPELAGRFSQTWRSIQLVSALRRGLMEKYVHCGVCTRKALD